MKRRKNVPHIIYTEDRKSVKSPSAQISKCDVALRINAGPGHVLQILFENQGRQSAEIPSKAKGVIVFLNGVILGNWTITGFPFDKLDKSPKLIEALKVLLLQSRFSTILPTKSFQMNDLSQIAITIKLTKSDIFDTIL